MSPGADSEIEPLTLLIVTVRDQVKAITVNLQGPFVLSSRSHVGTQLVLEEFPVRHPLVVPPRP